MLRSRIDPSRCADRGEWDHLRRLSTCESAEYVVFPFLIWAALRFGPAGSVLLPWSPASSPSGNASGTRTICRRRSGAGLVRCRFHGCRGDDRTAPRAVVLQDSRATEELRVRATQLAEADRARTIPGHARHELRNPLAPIVHSMNCSGVARRRPWSGRATSSDGSWSI